MRNLSWLLFTVAFSAASCSGTTSERKEATEHTKKYQEAVKTMLPFENTTDFEDANRGFIANSEGSMAFSFISNQSAPDTVNPSLWRQSQLNNITGLFEVTPGIYQVRGFDLANITFIRGNRGWIVVDPLTTAESAKKALDLFRAHQGNAPITGVIFTHSHADHFGGVRGIIEEKDIPSTKIVAPESFFEESISENLIAGNAMSRRAVYAYGSILPKDEKGTVDAGLGKGVALGSVGILEPSEVIRKDYQKTTIDGVEFEFIMAQNTEAPSEFMFYIPKYKAASSAEVINHTLHNLSTLRGAKTRNSLLWTDSIERTAKFLANRTAVLFGSHHWPTWGQEKIDAFLTKHGDLYRYIHDQTLRLANMGYTLVEISEKITLPDSLSQEFYNRGYYGTVNHGIKAVYDFYFGGWWDGNPVNLYKHEPEQAAKRYVEFMGGKNKIIQMAQKSFDKGDYRWVVEVLNHAIFANPSNQTARNLSADAMEQLGYQAESAMWRSYFLTGAKELREGIVVMPAPSTSSPDMIRALPMEEFLKYMAVRLNPEKVDGKTLSVNLTVGNDTYAILIKNSVMKFTKGASAGAGLSVSMPREAFNQLLLKQTDLNSAMGAAITASDPAQFKAFLELFDTFEFWFNIVLP